MQSYSIGIDMGATSIKLGLVDPSQSIVNRANIPVAHYRSPDDFFVSVETSVTKMLNDSEIAIKEVAGIGIGLPGCVDSVNGVVQDLTNMQGWRGENIPIAATISEKLGIPVRIDNDVNIMTIAEWLIGAGKGCRNLICCTLGTGVGGGLVLDGKLYRGSTLTAGEIGHAPLFYMGEPCNCGNRGCLERYVGNAAIVRRTQDMLNERPDEGVIIRHLIDIEGHELTPKIIFEAALEGDPIACEIFRQTGEYIGVSFSGLVNVLNPEKIVIGGGVANAGDLLLDPIRENICKYAMPVATKNLQILPATLGEDAGIYGAALYGAGCNE